MTPISEPRSGSSARLARATRQEQSGRILGTGTVAMAGPPGSLSLVPVVVLSPYLDHCMPVVLSGKPACQRPRPPVDQRTFSGPALEQTTCARPRRSAGGPDSESAGASTLSTAAAASDPGRAGSAAVTQCKLNSVEVVKY